MTWLYAAQFAVPLILIGWLMWAPARSGLGFVVQVFGSVAALAVVALQGTWLLPPWWVPPRPTVRPSHGEAAPTRRRGS